MKDVYESPLNSRYASKEMKYLFSPDYKFKTWRRLWIALAESEKELGLNITDEQIAELKAHADDINYDVAEAQEKEVRHDVMSHVYAYGVLLLPKDLKPGDLLFFNIKSRKVNHVAIYLGNDRFIHAPRRGKSVTIDTLKKPYWQSHYVVAKRVLPKEQTNLRVAQR